MLLARTPWDRKTQSILTIELLAIEPRRGSPELGHQEWIDLSFQRDVLGIREILGPVRWHLSRAFESPTEQRESHTCHGLHHRAESKLSTDRWPD